MSEKLEELISLLYQDKLTQYGKRLLVENIEKLQKENEELKNNIRKNENELEFDVNCDWIALQKMLDESEKSNEYISYKNEKWIKEKYCIPIQKIKAKIEELDKKVKDYQCVENRINLYQRKVLQELLEESEE